MVEEAAEHSSKKDYSTEGQKQKKKQEPYQKIYEYVCVYVWVCLCVYVCACVYVWVWMCACVCVAHAYVLTSFCQGGYNKYYLNQGSIFKEVIDHLNPRTSYMCLTIWGRSYDNGDLIHETWGGSRGSAFLSSFQGSLLWMSHIGTIASKWHSSPRRKF